MDYILKEGLFASANGTSNIFYRILTPRLPSVGVVFILHGMMSHSGTYLGFAEELTKEGYAVCLYDQAGHGRSVGEGESFGTFAAANGDVVLIKDLGSMVTLMRKRFRHLPFFLLGHSMGSFVARAYVASHPNDFDGAIFSGTCERMSFSFGLKRRLSKAVKKAGRAYSKEVEEIMIGDYKAAFPEEGSWITTNPAAFDRDDPLAGHPMLADAYHDMFRLIEYVSSDEWLKDYPKGMPTFFISGERDPLGGRGEGIVALADDLVEKDASDVVYRIYKGEKHETLGSLSDALVRADLLSWLNEKRQAQIALDTMGF